MSNSATGLSGGISAVPMNDLPISSVAFLGRSVASTEVVGNGLVGVGFGSLVVSGRCSDCLLEIVPRRWT